MRTLALIPLSALFVIVAGYGVGLRYTRRKAEAAREALRDFQWATTLRDMRDWLDVTNDNIFKVDSAGEVEAPPSRPVPVWLDEVMPHRARRPRRVSMLQIAWAHLALACIELVSDVAGWWGRRRVVDLSGLNQSTASVARVMSETIVSHRAREPRRLSVGWARLRSWPLESAPEFERWWRTAHHVSRHALREAPGTVGQRALWNASTGAWAVVRLARFDDLAKVRIAVSPTMGLRLRPAAPPVERRERELARSRSGNVRVHGRRRRQGGRRRLGSSGQRIHS